MYCTVQGLGTDDHTLVRVMVTRCEVDMEDIKDQFYQNYRKTLGSFIKVCVTQAHTHTHAHNTNTHRVTQVVIIGVF